MEEKRSMRLAFKARRNALTDETCYTWAEALSSHLWALPEVQQAHRIMAYLAMPKEANVDSFIAKALEEGKEVYVPFCVTSSEMVAVRLYSLEDIEEGAWHIRIPKEPHHRLEPENLDLLLVPGVAFDATGGRLGMGAGYYDRFMHALPQKARIGIAWSVQLSDEGVPMDVHDERVGAIVTNDGVLRV